MKFSAQALREIREGAGMTRERLAADSALSYPSIVAYELGRSHPPADKVGRLAEVLGVPVGELFTAEEAA